MKEEGAATDIEEGKAEVKDMVVEAEGAGGGEGEREGVLAATPQLKGEAGHAWDLN